MKTFSAFLFITIGFLSCKAQHEPWPKTKNWKVYKGEGQQVFSYSIDTLNSIPSKRLNQDSIQFFLENMVQVSDTTHPIWMGSYLASYESSAGKVHKVEVSIYGGFFYDESSGKYYNLPRQFNAKWLAFITGNMPY